MNLNEIATKDLLEELSKRLPAKEVRKYLEQREERETNGL